MLESLSFNYEEVSRVFKKLRELEDALIVFKSSFPGLQAWAVIYAAQSCVIKVGLNLGTQFVYSLSVDLQ